MLATRKTSTLMAGLLLAAALTPPIFAVGGSASVTVSFTMAPTVSAEVIDGGLFVRSNAPWELSAEVVDASGTIITVSECGPATGSAGVRVETGELVSYSLVLKSPR